MRKQRRALAAEKEERRKAEEALDREIVKAEAYWAKMAKEEQEGEAEPPIEGGLPPAEDGARKKAAGRSSCKAGARKK
mgnify:CR=1 FL=1